MSESILKLIYLENNGGLGNALRVALDNCSNELIARMDSDDIAMNRRFELQLKWMKKHPETDIVGGDITEFVGDENNIISRRAVPHSNNAIRQGMKSRCPFNHMTVMYKKTAIAAAGGYQDWFWNEDYYIWIRMMLNGAVMANLPYDLVNVRVGNEMSARRGGLKYFKSEEGLQRLMLKEQIIGLPQYLYNTAIRFGGEVIAPNWLRAKLFRFTRKPVSTVVTATVYNNGDIKPEHRDDQAENSADLGNNYTEKKKIAYSPFSVAMSVYKNDNPKWFDRALESITSQTVKPDEIVLVVDGFVPDEIHKVIDKYNTLGKS